MRLLSLVLQVAENDRKALKPPLGPVLAGWCNALSAPAVTERQQSRSPDTPTSASTLNTDADEFDKALHRDDLMARIERAGFGTV